MRVIKIAELIVELRQRKSFNQEQIKELSLSIESKGLFHPIVCVQDGSRIRLVAGERRIRAVTMLSNREGTYSCDEESIPTHEIPYVLIGEDLDAIGLREAELEENTIRSDLTWQEKVEAMDELHSLRIAQDPKQTIVQTAREIQAKQPEVPIKTIEIAVGRARIIAERLGSPEIANAKDENQAFKIASGQMDRDFRAELAKRVQESKEGGEMKHTLILGDAKEVLGIPSHVRSEVLSGFSCIIADPPYGIGADKFGNADQAVHTYKDTKETAFTFVSALLQHGYSATLSNAHIYIFCDIDIFCDFRDMATLFGWTPFRTPLIWHKETSLGHAPLQNRGFRRNYELILFASKGDKPFPKIFSDVISTPAIRGKTVAAQKPPELYKTLLSHSCMPGDYVLDPCCGSGTIFIAADELNLEATGIEVDKGAHAVALITLASLGEDDEEA